MPETGQLGLEGGGAVIRSPYPIVPLSRFTLRVGGGSAFFVRRHAKPHVKTSTRVIIFLALIVVYVGLIELTGARFLLFSSRYHGSGIDYYLVGDYIACFSDGPFIGPMDPYPFR